MSEGAPKKAGEQRKLKLLIKRALLMKYFVTFLYSDFDHLVELTLLIRSHGNWIAISSGFNLNDC